MSAVEPITAHVDRRRLATAVGGAAMLAGPALVLAGGVPDAVAVAVGVIGLIIALALVLPASIRAVARHPSLLLLIAFLGLAGLWLHVGLRQAERVPDSLGSFGPSGGPVSPVTFGPYYPPRFGPGALGWPWNVGRVSLLALAVLALAAAGGLVLVADAARLRLGITSLTPGRRAPWRILTEAPPRQASISWRLVPGVLLIVLAAFLAIGLADRYVGDNTFLESVVLIGVWGGAASSSAARC